MGSRKRRATIVDESGRPWFQKLRPTVYSTVECISRCWKGKPNIFVSLQKKIGWVLRFLCYSIDLFGCSRAHTFHERIETLFLLSVTCTLRDLALVLAATPTQASGCVDFLRSLHLMLHPAPTLHVGCLNPNWSYFFTFLPVPFTCVFKSLTL